MKMMHSVISLLYPDFCNEITLNKRNNQILFTFSRSVDFITTQSTYFTLKNVQVCIHTVDLFLNLRLLQYRDILLCIADFT